MAELISCPECKKHLQVPDELIGKRVQCPECKHTFSAELPDYNAPAAPTPGKKPPPKEDKTPEWERKGSGSSKRRKEEDEDKYDVEDRDDDDDDEGERPRRRRRRRASRNYGMPHRGGMILAFGLIGILGMGFFPLGLVFAIIAWVMGNGDMTEIRLGRMDPEGEGMTQAGRIMGIIATILHLLGVLGCCGYFACVFAIVAGNPPPPRRRF